MSDDRLKFVQYRPVDDFPLIEEHWQALSRQCGHHYFLSWGWMSTWLKSLPEDNDVRLIVGFHDRLPVMAFFAGLSRKRRYGIFRSRVVSLNTTGIPYFDHLYLEYNSILASPSLQADVELLFRAVNGMPWDEFNLPGLNRQFMGTVNSLLDGGGKFRALMDEQSAASFVDLEQVRASGMDYLRFLSSNRRSQIRRSIKEYEKEGEIEVIEAKNPQEALAFLDRLATLHQKEWQGRDRAGAFANEYFFQFHRDLVLGRFSHGEIQLLKIATSKTELGYLYNFIYNGRVYFYQSGFNYLPGNVYRPGLVAHYYAILHNAGAGKLIYDFLAGDADYKTSMATGSEDVYWVRIFRSPALFLMGKWVNVIKTRIKSVPRIASRLKKLRNFTLTGGQSG